MNRAETLAALPGSPEPVLWRLIGAGWYLLGWTERAERALRLAPEDARARYYMARIALDRARIALAGGPRGRTARSRSQLRQALQLLQSASAAASPLDRQVCQACRTTGARWPTSTAHSCSNPMGRRRCSIAGEPTR